MAAVVLPPGELSVEEALVDRRHLCGAVVAVNVEALRAEEHEDAAGVDGGHEAALVVEPVGVAFFGNAVADEGEARRAEGDQLVGVDGNVAGGLAAEGRLGGAVLHEVAGHPVVFAAGEAFDGLAEVAAKQRCAAFAGRADEHHGEALIEGHGDERGFAVARDAFDADMLGVDGGVGFEVVEAAARAPGPGAQRAPVVGLARLAVIDQADDAARKSRSVVGLHAGRIEEHKAPAVGDELPGVGRASVCVQLPETGKAWPSRLPGGMIREDILQRRVLLDEERLPCGVDACRTRRRGLVWRGEAGAAEHHQHRNRAFGVGRDDERHVDFHFDGGVGRVVDLADEVLGDDRT